GFVVVALDFFERDVEVGEVILGGLDAGSDLSESLAELIDDGWFHDVFSFDVAPDFRGGGLCLFLVLKPRTRVRGKLRSPPPDVGGYVAQKPPQLAKIFLLDCARFEGEHQRVWIGGNSDGGNFEQFLFEVSAAPGGLFVAVFPTDRNEADAGAVQESAAIKAI